MYEKLLGAKVYECKCRYVYARMHATAGVASSCDFIFKNSFSTGKFKKNSTRIESFSLRSVNLIRMLYFLSGC